MKTEDARSLSAKAQEALRRLVVQAVREGLTQAQAARLFGVARGTVNGWMGFWEREGSPTLSAGPNTSEKRSRFTGATRWGCSKIIKPAATMDAAARRPWCLAAVSASAAT